MNKRELDKEASEKEILDAYLSVIGFANKITITKMVRPDYLVVTPDGLRIGVEITRMTTEADEVMKTIMREHHRTDEKVQKIKKDAIEKHGKKAAVYGYHRICGRFSMQSPVFNVDDKKKSYASQIRKKFVKYESKICDFDMFVVLCDARFGIEITSKYDVEDVFSLVNKTKFTGTYTVAILYDDNGTQCIQHQFSQ